MTSNGVRTAQDIYDAYRIMPNLQLHQLRVAAVGKVICGNSIRETDVRTVILAGLFHDMGNIVKSDLVTFPDFLEPEGKAHWELVKKDFIVRYGDDEHAATAAIASEIGLSVDARALLGGIGFSKLEQTRDSISHELKVIEYADLRVGPHGVISMEARIMDAKERYANQFSGIPTAEDSFNRLYAAARKIEEQIFADADIAPGDITEQSIQSVVQELRAYPVA